MNFSIPGLGDKCCLLVDFDIKAKQFFSYTKNDSKILIYYKFYALLQQQLPSAAQT